VLYNVSFLFPGKISVSSKAIGLLILSVGIHTKWVERATISSMGQFSYTIKSESV
jgi:hypothetical protein